MGVSIKKLNESYCSVVWTGKDVNDPDHVNPLLYLDDMYALHPDGYQFDPRYKKREFTRYDGKIHLFNRMLGLLPLGLAKEALLELKKFGWKIDYDISIKDSFVNPKYNLNQVQDYIMNLNNVTGMSLRDYQSEILHKVVKDKRATLESATGSGKTITIYFLIRFLLDYFKPDEKILIIVPTIDLVYQTYVAMKTEYKWLEIDNVLGMYNSSLPKPYLRESIKKRCILSTWQSLANIQKKNRAFFNTFKGVIVDEAHLSSGKSINTIVNSCSNADYRIGLTGTVPKNLLFEKTIVGSIGPIKKVVDTKELQDLGVLAKCVINKVEIKYDKKAIKLIRTGNNGSKIKYQHEVELLRLNKSKQYVVSKLIEDGHISKTDNTLILVNKVKNGELGDMVKHLKENHPEFEVLEIHGAIAAEDREKIRQYVETASGVIIVATYKTMSTGINIPKLHNLVFLSSLKAFTTIIQSIGRVLRVHASKEYANIFDIVDDVVHTTKNGTTYRGALAEHYLTRESYYKEKGFPIKKIEIDKVFSVDPRDLIEMLNNDKVDDENEE